MERTVREAAAARDSEARLGSTAFDYIRVRVLRDGYPTRVLTNHSATTKSISESSILKAMPALASVNVSTPFIEVPQNALRVLLTAYGVSPIHPTVQQFDGYIYPLLLY